jgi:hypothetical protein
MNATVSPARAAAKRPRNSVPLLPEGSKNAKRLGAVILEVSAGIRTPLQAAEALGLSLPRYYQIEANGLNGLVAACTPKPKGLQANPARILAPGSCQKLHYCPPRGSIPDTSTEGVVEMLFSEIAEELPFPIPPYLSYRV